MFTGIVEETGTIDDIRLGRSCAVLSILADKILSDIHIGDSIAVNGICLTVTSFHSKGFCADVMHETLNRTGLASLKKGSRVNLERAMPVNGRFGGHIVAGHIDGTGTITDIRQDSNAIWYTIKAAPSIMRYIVEKGSVAIDGISLTVAERGPDHFSISAIPHTVAETTLSERKKGDLVNLENDIIGKYIEQFLMPEEPQKPQSRLTREFLSQYGY